MVIVGEYHKKHTADARTVKLFRYVICGKCELRGLVEFQRIGGNVLCVYGDVGSDVVVKLFERQIFVAVVNYHDSEVFAYLLESKLIFQ